MTTLAVQLLLLLVFSAVLGGIASAYRDDDRRAILRGTVRRGLTFALAVATLAVASWVVDLLFLRPDS